MNDYAGRVLADRYRLPLPPSDEYELVETRAFDTYSGQEVLVRQVPLPEVVDAEVLDAQGPVPSVRQVTGRAVRRPADPAVRRAVEAAQEAARIPDHPRLDQVFDVFAEAGSLWIVSEFVAARPLAALLAERPLDPFRAAEIGSDVLTALRVLHAHGWTHRNITVRTVMICDDGRVVLTGLAAGAAEEALCGYVSTPQPDDEDELAHGRPQGGTDPAGVFAPPRPSLPPGPAELPAARGPLTVEKGRASGDADDDAYGDGDEDGDDEARGVHEVEDGRDAYADAPYGGDPYTKDPYTTASYGDAPYGEAPYGDAAHGDSYDGSYRDEADGHDVTGPGHDDEDDDEEGLLPPARRMHLTGVWSDGPGDGRPVPAGGTGASAAPPDTWGPVPVPALPAPHAGQEHHPGRWDDLVASGHAADTPYRGPDTPLAAERARQTRIAVVGAVTERWAPEQGGPIHENWRLAPPIGPATDLWALGALLYRAVQGHAPYPEENAAELVQMVCGEPPAFAEECGPLRPVVESLLRQDPSDRPDIEELSGWLRSLVRSAPEPEAGLDVVPLPSADATRLPVVRRRGELVRRRRFGRGAAHGRHRHTRERPERTGPPREESPRAEKAPRPARTPREPKGPKALRTPPPGSPYGEGRSPRRLGRLLLVLILLALAAAVGYAVLFMPKADDRTGAAPGTGGPETSASGAPRSGTGTSGDRSSTRTGGAQQPQTTRSAVALAAGYTLREDPEGFEIGVLKSWRRTPANADRQIRYTGDGFTLLVVPGRDSVETEGADPLAYQADKERELRPFRESGWSGSSGLRRIDVGRQTMAEGQFTWQDANGREVYARNLAMIVDGRYHVVQVIGPESRRDEVSDIYQQAIGSYRVTR